MRKRSFKHRIDLNGATYLVLLVCRTAGEPSLISEAHHMLRQAGVIDAVGRHDNDVLFGWLMEWCSYQGVSDAVAAGYMDQHGRIASADLRIALAENPACPKLGNYWTFEGCRYRKVANSCTHPDLLPSCPLPKHTLRNGRLNQTAYSLYLFLRDVARGDFVDWLDCRLAQADVRSHRNRGAALADAVIGPMANIFGVSHKVLTMAMSWLMLAADANRERWQTAGASMVAIDTLVHNWLHRTGILDGLDASHLYGTACYAPNGCAEIIARIARRIDATEFNPNFPRYFPRWPQHAIWRFCSQSGLNECNGNRVNDRKRCSRDDCELFGLCGRVVLNPRA